YIGQQPTPRANRYLVLKFDFSGVPTTSPDALEQIFASEVQRSILRFIGNYTECFREADYRRVEQKLSASDYLAELLTFLSRNCPREKVFLIVDEYDHFTNELVAFYPRDFDHVVSRNGFVRKFYENIKKGTQMGIIDRIFMTGVSPITLDSLTSGFNIADNLTLDLNLHDLMGFREEEVGEL
ncbi:MAG: AAA family ATPase, partial [Saprospiraceae bacterium]|nr:AAA family ATPase [Saprospiraceae bacterium]